jgi:predicted metal-dependent phosphoesterase TrpH
MLIDMHAHSSGISRCCRTDARTVMETAKANDIDGLILTNHYQEAYLTDEGSRVFAEKYINEYFYYQPLLNL